MELSSFMLSMNKGHVAQRIEIKLPFSFSDECWHVNTGWLLFENFSSEVARRSFAVVAPAIWIPGTLQLASERND